MKSPSIPKRYEVRSLLGEGGSGRVYRVQDSVRDRELALKLVTSAESAFLRLEFDTLRQIRHENLIQVFDWGAFPSGEAYYTMELIEGGDWAKRMGEPQSADDVRRVLTGLLRGLAHLHCHGEIHGDLKPGNILLGAGGVVKITDTGMGGGEGRASGSSGTPGYAAPEIWEGATADIRSDLYSVGVMAYEALTGKHPFAGRTVRDVISGQLEGWVPSPGAHGVKVPADLERVVMRALERQPELRQGSADEFMEGFGVEDRIGEILGGKLVGREKEIAEIEKLLYSEEPGTPTLLYLVGESQIGKTAMVTELSHRHSARGGRTLPEVSVLDLFDYGSPESDARVAMRGDRRSISRVADDISRMATASSLLIWLGQDVTSRDIDQCRELARYLWSLSTDSAKPARCLFLVERQDQIPNIGAYELNLRLQPFDPTWVMAQVRGMLGAAHFEEALLGTLQNLTGGSPGALSAVLTDLIYRQLVARRDNAWFFREAERIQSLQLPASFNIWTQTWEHLVAEQRSILLRLALLVHGLSEELAEALDVRRDVLALMEARGLVRLSARRWFIASEGIRQVVLSTTRAADQASAAGELLTAGPILSIEERAELALQHGPSERAQEEGTKAAQLASEKGDFRAAVRLLRKCLGLSRTLDGERPATRMIALQLADALHQLGEYSEAGVILGDVSIWKGLGAGTVEATHREYLAGKLHRSLGDLEGARMHFQSAVNHSPDQVDGVAFLSQVELAELDWRHGTEAQRDDAIGRLQSLVGSTSGGNADSDKQAAVMYQLGGALYAAGRVSEARERLLQGRTAASASPYWRMRIAIALGVSCDHLGHWDEAHQWHSRAWECAESAGFDGYKPRILSNRGGLQYRRGMFRDALDQNRLSAVWSRRLGNLYEFAAACAGVSINLITLARYDEAISEAEITLGTAEQIGDFRYVAKAFEFKALAQYHIGLYADAESAANKGLVAIRGRGIDEVQPRLDWILGKVYFAQGEVAACLEHLELARQTLLRTKDLEDLPGVQIELLRLTALQDIAKGEESARATAKIITMSPFPITKIWGAVVLAEIIVGSHITEGIAGDILELALADAETAGVAEASWQLNYWLGVLDGRAGNLKSRSRRFGQVHRILREITGNLSPDQRRTFLGAPHVRSAFRSMDQPD
jgi:tetratricopeptide (TPR) repeat protein